MNKYYEMFINEKVDESILKVNIKSLSFEDEFWYYSSLSIYYKQKKNYYLQKKALTIACNLNYYYNAFIYFDAYFVLPQKFKRCLTKFEHPMNDDKLEKEIKYANKKDNINYAKKYFLYGLLTLLVIPLMLLLVLVLKMDSTLATIIAIGFIFIMQSFTNPMIKRSRNKSRYLIESKMNQHEKTVFYHPNIYDEIMNDERYIAMIKAKDEETIKKIAHAIKNNLSVNDIVNKKNK